MSNTDNKKISVFSILIFILCGLLTLYTIWSAVSVTSYIKEMFAYGSVSFKENSFDIISYYMTNCGNNIIYIAILLSIWWVSSKKKVDRVSKDILKTEPAENEEVKEVIEEILDVKNDKPATDKVETKIADKDVKPAVNKAKTDDK